MIISHYTPEVLCVSISNLQNGPDLQVSPVIVELDDS